MKGEMKGKTSRTGVSAAAIVAALLLATPMLLLIAPVHAISITSISPTSGPVGTTVSLTGTIDTFNGPFKVYFDANGDGIFSDPAEVVASGTAVGTSVSVSFNVPPAVKGTRAIRLTDVIANTHGFAAFTVERAVTITFTPSTGRIQEGDTIDITVSISGGLASTTYSIDIKVTDPTGTTFTESVSISTNSVGSGSTSKTYPTDFSGATTRYVGTYNVVVDITAPAGEAGTGVATNSFVVGLTDKDSYGRKAVVNIKGVGYSSGESVTVDVKDPSGASVSGYPKIVTATAGVVTDSLTIPVNAPLGIYTVTLTGTTTSKTPPDTQTFAVTAATLTVSITDQPASTYQRTQTATMKFQVKYPDDSFFTPTDLGSVTVKVFRGTTLVATLTLTASDFESATNKWVAKWTIPKDATIATNYRFQIAANDITDTFGNTGPASAETSNNFAVTAATLTVSITDQPASTYQRTQTATMKFQVKYPDDSFFTPTDLGSVTVKVFRGTTLVATLTLTASDFESATNKWVAKWTIPKDATIATNYRFQIAANDITDTFGNTGPASAETSNNFAVTAVTLTVPAISTDKSTYVGGSWMIIFFTASYPDGSPVTTGTATITIKRPDGSTAGTPTASFSAANARFEASFFLPTDAPLGTWTAELAANSLNDGFGNTGPTTLKTTTFQVVAPTITLETIYDVLTTQVVGKLGMFSGSDTVASLLYHIKEAVDHLGAFGPGESVKGMLDEIKAALGSFTGTDNVASLLYAIKDKLDKLDDIEAKLDDPSRWVSDADLSAAVSTITSAISEVSAKLGTFTGTDTVASLLYQIRAGDVVSSKAGTNIAVTSASPYVIGGLPANKAFRGTLTIEIDTTLGSGVFLAVEVWDGDSWARVWRSAFNAPAGTAVSIDIAGLTDGTGNAVRIVTNAATPRQFDYVFVYHIDLG
jgi:hypothetical protein